MTTVLTTGPARRPSTASIPDAVGGVSVANHHVCRPFVAGCGRSSSPATASGPTATTTARARTVSPCSTSTSTMPLRGVIPCTLAARRTSAPEAVAERASWAGRAPMPASGRPGAPRMNMRTRRRAKDSDVAPRSSASTPARNGSSTSRAQRAAEPDAVPSVVKRTIRSGDDGAGSDQHRRDPANERGRVSRGEQPTAERSRQGEWVAHRMPQLDASRIPPHPDPDRERPHPQVINVHPALHGGIGGVEHVEPAVELEPVEHVGALAPTDPVLRLEHDDVESGLRETHRAPQAGQACADDDDVVSVHGPTIGAHARKDARRGAIRLEPNPPSDRQTKGRCVAHTDAAAYSARYWIVPVVRAVLAFLPAIAITFIPDHSADFGLAGLRMLGPACPASCSGPSRSAPCRASRARCSS